MFDTYQDIFNARGDRYHHAMQTYPLARAEEFRRVIELAELEDDQTICDVPSGGCYLKQFVSHDVNIASVETAIEFSQLQASSVYCQDLTQLPFAGSIFDRVISLAAVHHIENQSGFFQEIHHILKPNGYFILADVAQDSAVAQFLNVFVDQFNSMGHQGRFVTQDTVEALRSVGFAITYDACIRYHWVFDSLACMIDFCTCLFGLDQASPDLVHRGIASYLGYHLLDNEVQMNWEIRFLKCSKQDDGRAC